MQIEEIPNNFPEFNKVLINLELPFEYAMLLFLIVQDKINSPKNQFLSLELSEEHQEGLKIIWRTILEQIKVSNKTP